MRVNDRGPFIGDRIIDLSKAAAEQLGYGRAGIANVRVRYVGPAGKARPFEQRRQVASAPPSFPRDEPPPPTRTYAGGLPPAQAAYGPPPPPKAADPDFMSSSAPTPMARAYAPPPGVSSSAYRVQAGSFSSRANAERAAARLSDAGEASIESIERDQGVLYRVVVKAGPDEAEAFGVRDRVARLGFSDATVLRP